MISLGATFFCSSSLTCSDKILLLAVEDRLPDFREPGVLRGRRRRFLFSEYLGGCPRIDRVEGAGLQRQATFLPNHVADADQAFEIGIRRGGVRNTQNEPGPGADSGEKPVHEVSEILCIGGELRQQQVGRDPAENGDPVAPAPVVLLDADLGHGRRADRFGHVHARLVQEVHQPEVLAVGVAKDPDVFGAQNLFGFPDPGHEVLGEHRREGEHVVEVRTPLDDLGRRFRDNAQRLLVQRGQGIGQVEYFRLVVAIVMEEFGGIQKVFLDVVNRPGRHGEGRDRQAVLTHLRLVGFEGFVIGHHVHVFKHIGQHLQVIRGLDGMLLDPGDRGTRAPHLLAVHGAGGDGALRRGVADARAVAFALYFDFYLAGEREVRHVLLHEMHPQCPVQHGIGVGLVQMIRNHLVQGPAFGERYLVAGLALMSLRQGAVQGVGVEPQVDAGCVRDVVRHVAPHRREQSLSMSHHR